MLISETAVRASTVDDFDAMLALINRAAQKYNGVIPADCWHIPYMSHRELQSEIDSGVQFVCHEISGALAGIMGTQHVKDVTLIRHAYVLPVYHGKGIGSTLLTTLTEKVRTPVLVGTWADADWAIGFYQRHGFVLASTQQKETLLHKYWNVSQKQKEASVVLTKREGSV